MKKLALTAIVVVSILLLGSLFSLLSIPTWNMVTVDSLSVGSSRTSLLLDSVGNPHIMYICNLGTDYAKDTLKYATWDGTKWTCQTIDALNIGESPLASYYCQTLDSKGNPSLIYDMGGYVKYAVLSGKSWKIETVDYGFIGNLVLDSSGNPHLCYRGNHWDNYSLYSDLKYAHWTGSTWNIETVDSQKISQYGDGFSLALDPTGKPHIVFSYALGDDNGHKVSYLKYASLTNSIWNIQTIDNDTAYYLDFLLDPAGNPNIGYVIDNQTRIDLHQNNPRYGYVGNFIIKFASWDGTQWKILTAGNAVPTVCSLAMDSKGNPHLWYNGETGATYASWTGSKWNIQSFNTLGYFVYYNSLILDSNDNPHISYGSYAQYLRWAGFYWDNQFLGENTNSASLAVDSNGDPHLSYFSHPDQYQQQYGNLTYATLSQTKNVYVLSVVVIDAIAILGATFFLRKKLSGKTKIESSVKP